MLAAEDAVCLEETVDCRNDESADDDCNYNIADIEESLLPNLVSQTHSLECAPETVAEVESESYEPYDVDSHHPPALECEVEEYIWIFSVLTHELLELHVSPEMVEVESHETENDNSENKHVL